MSKADRKREIEGGGGNSSLPFIPYLAENKGVSLFARESVYTRHGYRVKKLRIQLEAEEIKMEKKEPLLTKERFVKTDRTVDQRRRKRENRCRSR